MAMGAAKVVAEPLTITGSIGVVTAKFNLKELYQRVGFSKEVISRGKCEYSFPNPIASLELGTNTWQYLQRSHKR